jgi:DNA recombination protein RmuC
MDTALLIVLVILVALVVALQVVRRPQGRAIPPEQVAALRGDSERVERTLREEQRAGRGELAQSFHQFRGQLQTQLDTLTTQLLDDARKSRVDGQVTMQRFGTNLQTTLERLGSDNQQRIAEVRSTLDRQLKILQDDNAAQLEKMRATVDEKLQATLETRLAQSFTQISERLEAVQRGLGEMQALATGVGDLQRVLTNVKTRGIFGETQLAVLLEETLTPEQYECNVATVPGSNARVEFAIRLPGTDGGTGVLLPIDAKFPREDFERLLDAQERADGTGATVARQALVRRVENEAEAIRAKYIAVPHTTDFAILFLATESLYAEVLRQPGLFEQIQSRHQVMLAGPTTLLAILNSLRMGFRTLAIEKRSSEVWEILGAVKTEFGKFATVLERTRKQLDAARNTIDSAGVRTRAIERKLRSVESLPASQTQALLGELPDGGDGGDGDGEDGGDGGGGDRDEGGTGGDGSAEGVAEFALDNA